MIEQEIQKEYKIFLAQRVLKYLNTKLIVYIGILFFFLA